MNKALKKFLHRGLIFGGLGPVVMGIVYAILQNTVENFSLNGAQVFIAILSTYFLAFLQAGASVFNQIENWSVTRSLATHFSTLYVSYVSCYLINNWIPFRIQFLLFFTLIFFLCYLAVWLAVFLSVKAAGKKLNEKIGKI